MTREEKADLIQNVADWVRNNYPLDEEINGKLVEIGKKIIDDGLQSKADFILAFAKNDVNNLTDAKYQTGRQMILVRGFMAVKTNPDVQYYLRMNNLS